MGTLLSPEKKWHNPHPNFGPCLLWPNRWMDQDDTWHGGGPQSRHIVLDGDPAPPTQKGGRGPNFRPISIVAKPLDASTCHLVWSRHRRMPYCARWGPSLPPAKKRAQPPTQFSANVYCGQTAGVIKMPLRMEVDFDPCKVVSDGDPAPPRKGLCLL